jgi:hypothetical protein
MSPALVVMSYSQDMVHFLFSNFSLARDDSEVTRSRGLLVRNFVQKKKKLRVVLCLLIYSYELRFPRPWACFV